MPYDLIQRIDELRKFKMTFVVSPKNWQNFSTPVPLNWVSVRFTSANRISVPTEKGVYAFVIGHHDTGLPPHGYPMYVGQTGHDSNQTLRLRYGVYLSDQKSKSDKRPKVKELLTRWKDCLFFYYAPVTDRRYSLKKLEAALNDSLIPPCSTNDFSAGVRTAVRAL